MSMPLSALTLAAALGAGLVGGVFLAFSSFVMAGLERLPAPQGVAAMQAINRTAVTPLFMTLLFGAAAACLALVVVAATRWGSAQAPWLLAGGVVYLLGPIGLTIARNVPLNDGLERLDPNAADAAQRWSAYLADWSIANHGRALAGLVAAALLTIALTVE